MSHALGAHHGVAHGMGNAILLPLGHALQRRPRRSANRLKDVATALSLTVPSDPVEAANAAADKVSELLVATGHPVKLAQVKVPKDDLEATAESAFLDPANLYNARAVSFPTEITELLSGRVLTLRFLGESPSPGVR